MQKIKLNERQILMLQNLQGDKSNTKVIKINEDQYNRLFKGSFNANKRLDKNLKKSGLDEESKKGDLLSFAQEVIVFIKDMLSRPESAPFSKYWAKKGVSKEELTSMLEKEGLLTMNIGEGDGVKTYVTEKFGFRGKIKEFYNTMSEYAGSDPGYPAGAQHDPNAPWNQDASEPAPEDDTSQDDDNVVLDNEAPLQLKFYSGSDDDNLMVFTDRSGRLVLVNGERLIAHSKYEEFEVYQTIKGDDRNLKAPIFYYVNDKYKSGEMKVYNTFDAYTKGQLVVVTPEIKNELLNSFQGNNELASLLNQLPETTGAASSGAYVGGMSGGPINKGRSPESEMKNIIADGIDSTGVVPFHSERSGEDPFIIDGIKWQYVNAQYDGKVDIGVYRYGQDICYSYEWFNDNVLKSMQEMDSATAGGESGTFAFDAPAGDGSAFWNAGNKLNKGKGAMPMVRGAKITESFHTPEGIPIPVDKNHKPVGPPVGFDSWEDYEKNKHKHPFSNRKIDEGFKVGQVYKNALGRRKINNINHFTGKINVRQWGDGNARDLDITKKDFGGWELLSENKIKVMKITEAQLKKILEVDNQTSTAYPNGEFVDFDDCTKLNNNKVAQNGGCSQGAVDNVVKTKKTKNSVVAEDYDPNYKPNVAPGSTYSIQVQPIRNGAYLALTQDNGQTVVVHYDDIGNLIKVMDSFHN